MNLHSPILHGVSSQLQCPTFRGRRGVAIVCVPEPVRASTAVKRRKKRTYRSCSGRMPRTHFGAERSCRKAGDPANDPGVMDQKAGHQQIQIPVCRSSVSPTLEDLALLDPLTGVRNRRGLDPAMASEWARASATGGSLSVLFLDIDYFKRFNDTYGHQSRCYLAVSIVFLVLRMLHSVKMPD
jgi:GGDEF domain-containing protein